MLGSAVIMGRHSDHGFKTVDGDGNMLATGLLLCCFGLAQGVGPMGNLYIPSFLDVLDMLKNIDITINQKIVVK
jgi:hypothetical protein